MPVLDPFGLVLEKPSGAREPPTCDRAGALLSVVAGDHHCQERGSPRLVGLHVGRIRALAEIDRFLKLSS